VSNDSSDCNFQCAGDASETCGAGNRLDVYKKTTTTTNDFSTYGTRGCYTDEDVTARALDGKTIIAENMTVELCTSICGAEKFAFFGLEYCDEVSFSPISFIVLKTDIELVLLWASS
jgi:hypothetical protein